MSTVSELEFSTVLAVVVGPPLVLIALFAVRRGARSTAAHWRRRSAQSNALRILRGHRPSADERWWPRDWAWAYRTVGTPEALRLAATWERLS